MGLCATVHGVADALDFSTLGRRLLYARARLGLTQVQASTASGITQGALSPLENDATKEPRATTVSRLARTYGVNADWLLTGRGAPDDPELDETPRQVVEVMAQMTSGNRRRLLALAHSLLADQQAEAGTRRRPSAADPFPDVPKPTARKPASRPTTAPVSRRRPPG